MEWPLVLGIFLGILLLLLFTGVPVAICFLATNLIVVGMVYGFDAGLNQLVFSMFDAVAKFTLTPIPAFVLLGEALFRSGLAIRALDVISQFIGRLPGRLSLLSVGSGTMFAALSGSSIANTSMLGALLVPDMRRRGYDIRMSAGPVMASGTLAMLIPPSAVAVILGGVAKISVTGLLLGGVLPGILMATLFAAYIMVRCGFQPELAPSYETSAPPMRERLLGVLKYVAPLMIVILVVVGLIFAGWATPTESASLGCIVAVVLIACYGKLRRPVILDSLKGTLRISGMIMFILASAAGFSQLLAFSGATSGLIQLFSDAAVPDFVILAIMIGLVILLGAFVEQTAIIMMTMPLFMPIVVEYGFNPVWFGIMILIALDLGGLTPPFGLNLFVMKGVLPDVPMTSIYRSAVPFIGIEIAVIAIVMAWPSLVLWLPGLGSA